jgi:heme exporter protein D
VTNEVLHTVKKKRNFLNAVKRRKANKVVHVLRRNCLIIQVI